MIAIIDYGLGNLGSIANMLRVTGARSVITEDRKVIQEADKIILPGVGAFDAGMEKLEQSGLVESLQKEAGNGKPILGICLGMQLLGDSSEEGVSKGLGLIPFHSVKFDTGKMQVPDDMVLRVPHMGWDIVDFCQSSSLLDGIEGQQRYYFVHSYHAVCEHQENVLMTCEYGYSFAAAVVKENIYGVQFHPEKSHDFGMRLLDNFAHKC